LIAIILVSDPEKNAEARIRVKRIAINASVDISLTKDGS
jgi:hypothetical protein